MMIKKILTIILLFSILAFNASALDIISVNTNNATLNRTNFWGSSVSFSNVTSYGNVYTISNNTTNQAVVSPLGTNNVAGMWQGTYTEYLSLTNKLDTTTYIITDQAGVYDSIGIYSEKYDYTAISPTTTVTIAQDKACYVVELSTSVTIDIDTNDVNLINKVANFQLALNFTSTNALAPTFGPMFDWGGFIPEFTVTGRYEYACTMVGDGKIRIKQTYPTMQLWNPVVFTAINNASPAAAYIGVQPSGASATSSFVIASCPFPIDYSILKIGTYRAGANTNVPYITCGVSAYFQTPSAGNLLQTNNLNFSVSSTTIGVKPNANLSQACNYYLNLYTTGNIASSNSPVLFNAVSRKMNENETRAFITGWRP